VERNEISYNGQHGLRPGPGMQVLNNSIHHNAVVGINGYKCDNVLVEGNEVAFNGTGMTAETPALAEAAGLKFLKQNNLIVRNNNVHDNLRGIWIDTAYLGTRVENNRVTGSLKAGIYIEATYGAVVANNIVERNGFNYGPSGTHAGIQVISSPDVEVYQNTVTGNALGITGTQGSGYPIGPYGPMVLSNLNVHDNTVTMATGWTGVEDQTGDPAVFSGRNNRFTGNIYFLTSTLPYFHWVGQSLTATQWKAAGQDVNGKFTQQ
jgi:parallel beta-helix repeat protein